VVLVEPGLDVVVEGVTEALIGIASAPGGDVRVTRVIESSTMRREERGQDRTWRRVTHLLPPAVEAGRLILVEVFTPGGNWSSYPPHKHDTEDPPREAYLEEIYHYRFARAGGYALTRIYTPDRSLDVAFAPGQDDLVLVPRGYHPVGLPAGYDGWYLNAMAGPTRAWNFSIDPDHAWLLDWDPDVLRR
jgi:5-deoxy-glucuronate isomerase